MYSDIRARYAGNNKSYVEGVCISTDSKPTDGIANGSIILEMDTKKVYMYDEAGDTWREISD